MVLEPSTQERWIEKMEIIIPTACLADIPALIHTATLQTLAPYHLRPRAIRAIV